MNRDEAHSTLPDRYYLHHFGYFLDFVERHYGPLLSPREQECIASFRKLGEQARCLFVRLLNRRSRLFRLGKLSYAEIPDVQAAVEELSNCGFALPFDSGHVLDGLQLFTVKELRSMASGTAGAGPQLTKSVLVQHLHKLPWTHLRFLIDGVDRIIALGRREQLDFLLFLFFGELEASLTLFVRHDLRGGVLPAPDDLRYTARYTAREEAELDYALASLHREAAEAEDEPSLASVAGRLDALRIGADTLGERIRGRRERLAMLLADRFEKAGIFAEALRYYSEAETPPSRERRVRIHERLGQPLQARRILEEMNSCPRNAEERIFAADRLRVRGKRKAFRSTTRRLKAATVIPVSASFKEHPEAGVIAAVEAAGQRGAFTENAIWRALFGLVFWPEMARHGVSSLHCPFDSATAAGCSAALTADPEAVQRQLGILEDRAFCPAELVRRYNEHRGAPNPFLRWDDEELALVLTLYDCVGPTKLSMVLKEIVRDPQSNLSGFPDLFVYSPSSYCFIEVKSPSDQLAPQQLHWLEFFEEHGIASAIARIHWVWRAPRSGALLRPV